MLQDIVKLIAVIGVFTVTACGTAYELFAPPGANINPPKQGYEDPDGYRVDSSSYPSYAANRDYSPPRPRYAESTSRTQAVEIKQTDLWRVTHRVGALLVVYSDRYQQRQCEYLLSQGKSMGALRTPFGGVCQADYLYHLLITPEGRAKGWFRLHSPERVIFSRDRYVVMDPASRMSLDWPEEVLFTIFRR